MTFLASIAYDPLSANRRFAGAADLAVLGTLVFAGATRHSISVMVPDCLLPPENNTVKVDLRHHVGLSLGSAVDMTNWSPEAHLERALCLGPLLDTLELQRRDYWNELSPILKRWKSVNDSKCPDCDDGSTDDGMMLLSMPHDIPEVTFPVVRETRDEDTPVVISRRLTPANRPLQLLEAGRLGASATEHLPSRPAVPDLCIASSSLLSALDPLPLDRLSRHTVEEITLWPAADRHAILAVANRDVRIARQNIAELLVHVDDHAAHLANCASANDDSLTLMSAELIPRLEGGIRAVLDEAANL